MDKDSPGGGRWMRTSVREESQATCWECGIGGSLHNHHVVPQSRGGTRTVPLCEACHSHAHHKKKNMTISRLTAEALGRKQANGEYTGGDVPYGYRLASDGVRLEDDPVESRALDFIRQRRAHGMSIRALAAELNARGVLNRGRRWNHGSLGRLCRDRGNR